VKPASFAYHRAHSVAEAVALLTELGDEAKILAGGLSLVPMMEAVLTEFAQRQGDFAVVAAAISADIADGVCRQGRVVLGGVGPPPVEVDAGPLAQAAGAQAAGGNT
jgi:CO/xanthine dehydrogenase FAD-binding subunit